MGTRQGTGTNEHKQHKDIEKGEGKKKKKEKKKKITMRFSSMREESPHSGSPSMFRAYSRLEGNTQEED